MHPKDMTLRPIIRKAVASKFNKFFATIGCRIAKKLRSVSRDAWKKYETVSQADGENLCELWWVSSKVVSKILHSLEVNKAAGLDKISARLLRDAEQGHPMMFSVKCLFRKAKIC